MEHVRCPKCSKGVYQVYVGGRKDRLENHYYCKDCETIVELKVKISVQEL